MAKKNSQKKTWPERFMTAFFKKLSGRGYSPGKPDLTEGTTIPPLPKE